ncbi:MAG: molybdopterin-dependent oxidoreductase [Holophagales bacterium]|jgi:formate dehydrogenase major subunit|nr:molybdopterin-dependent oxidoreductase [Holophagales bacterium]
MATEMKQTSQIELTVNGQKVTAAAGQTILDVVREQKLDDIPTLCHDPRLEPYGSCFLCVVEVKGWSRLIPACVTRVTQGMEVTTRNPRIVSSRKTALELLLTDHYADCLCPGKNACPAGVDVQGYMSLASMGHYREALDLIRESNPLPMTCGRVCVRKCEVKCLRQHVDEGVGVNFIKRYTAEIIGPVLKKPDVKASGRRVAIVGGGPSGLTCAYYLTMKGHEVTIFESLPKLGGMLRYGIPEYRLPRKELDDEIQGILDLGVKVEIGKTLGKDFTIDSLRSKNGFNAVFVALGAPLGKKMGIENEDSIEGVSPALDFLRDCELKGVPKLTGKVAVVGGGNSAIDAARSSIRCGAEEVMILYRRTRKEMPAHHEEVDAAEKEGVKLEILAAPLELLAENGKLTAIRCQRMKLGEPDASGRRKPVPIPGAIVDFPCSYVFAAIGQDTDLGALDKEPENGKLAVSRWATINADNATMETSVKGVFAGGDVVLGPATVIEAIAQGKTAALAIDQYLIDGKAVGDAPEFHSRREFFGAFPEGTFSEVCRQARNIMPEREASERVRDFVQVELGLDRSQMNNEADRCMECGCKSVFKCDLKRYAGEYGVDLTRLVGEVRRHKADLSHPLISLDPNKCVLCGRCVRTCSQVVGLGVISFMRRGFSTVVSPALGKSLIQSDCIACGSCVENCPTGALEAKLPYGKQGPWKTENKPSVCAFCSVGCDLNLNVAADGLLWATSAERAPLERGGLCMKGRFGTGLLQVKRLQFPMVRKSGTLIETSWKAAFDAAAKVLRNAMEEHGADAVGVLAAPRMTLEEAWLTRLVAGAIGTKEIGCFGQAWRGGPRSDLDQILGGTFSTCAFEDIAGADLILLASADPETTHPALGMAIRRALKRGAELAVVNSLPISILRPEDLWLDARRGTAGMIYATAIARVLKNGNGNQPIDAADLAASVKLLTEIGTASVSGVNAAKIVALADKISAANKVVAIYDLDDTLERSADDLAGLAQLLAVTGHLGKQGEGILLLRTDCNGVGARLTGIDTLTDTEKLRAALVMFENPFRGGRVPDKLANLTSLVVVDHFLTETAEKAEVILPAATMAESTGTVVSFDNRTVGIDAAVRPVCGLSNLEILAELAAALGLTGLSYSPDDARRDLAASLGINAVDIEKARAEKACWPGKAATVRTLIPLKTVTTVPKVDLLSYASMDGFVKEKLNM